MKTLELQSPTCTKLDFWWRYEVPLCFPLDFSLSLKELVKICEGLIKNYEEMVKRGLSKRLGCRQKVSKLFFDDWFVGNFTTPKMSSDDGG